MSNLEQLRHLAHIGAHREARELASGELEWLYVIDHSFMDLLCVESPVAWGRGVGNDVPFGTSGTGAGAAFVDGSGIGTGLEGLEDVWEVMDSRPDAGRLIAPTMHALDADGGRSVQYPGRILSVEIT